MNIENLRKLSVRKRQLKAMKAGETVVEGIRPYEEMQLDVRLLFDTLSDVIDTLTEENK